MNNTIFYLIGATAALRTAVAKELGALAGARVVDTPDIYAPIFNVVVHDHIADLPDGVWTEIDAVRGAVLHTIETLSPKDWSFVFTHAGLGIPADVGVYRTVKATATKRTARFVPVTLTAGKQQKLLTFDEPSQTVDVGSQSPEAAAQQIVSAAGR